MSFKRWGVFAFFAIAFIGCGRYSGLSTDFPKKFEKPKTRADFVYEGSYQVIEMTRTQRQRGCYISEFVIETSYPQLGGDTHKVEGYFYEPRRLKEAAPVVVIFPPVGGVNGLDKEMGETFCDQKMAAFIPTTDFTSLDLKVFPPAEDHNHALFRVVSFVKAINALSVDDDLLDQEKLGVMGASLGGILSAFAMSVIPEVSAGFFIVGGGDFPSILAHSKQDRVRALKRQRYQEQGFANDDEYETWLREQILYDPLDFAEVVAPESVQMVISLKDSSVPTINQWLLHEAFGSPQVRTSKKSHIFTIFKTLFREDDREEIVDFFRSRFEKENPRQDFLGLDLFGPTIP